MQSPQPLADRATARSGKTVAVTNQKGGVGKTTVAVNLAEYAVDLGGRVLLIDLDGQGGATLFYLDERPEDGDGTSQLFGVGGAMEPLVVRDRLALLPADSSVADMDALPDDSDEHFSMLDGALAALRDRFDLIIIDCPPARSRRQASALAAADFVVVPFGLDKGSVQGMVDMVRDLGAVRASLNPALRYGLLANRLKRANDHQRESLEGLRSAPELAAELLPCVIDDRSPIGAAFDAGRCVWQRPQGESARKAASEVRAAMQAILDRVHGHE